jgi:[ribosomal protein S5]-alanine N-acetyltransferase
MRVFLRSLSLEDANSIYPWLIDDDIKTLTSGNTFFPSKEYLQKWIEEKLFTKDEIYLAICLIENKEIIGYLSIKNIDFRNRKAIWGGITIGRKNLWGQGIATEAANLMLKFVFEELNINLLWAFWLESNFASIRMAEKIGFFKIGILPQSIFKGNRYHNMVIMYILKEQYHLKMSNE